MNISGKANMGILLSALLVGTIFLVISIIFLDHKKEQDIKQTELFLRSIVEGERQFLAHEIFQSLDESILLRLNSLKSGTEIVRINLFDQNGFLLHQEGGRQIAVLPEIVFDFEMSDYSFEIVDDEITILKYIQPIHAVNTLAGYLEVQYSMEGLKAVYVGQYRIIIGQILIFLVVLFFSLNLTLYRIIIKPLAKLTRFSRALEKNGPGGTIQLARDDEIGEMSIALNSMSTALAVSQKENAEQKEKLIQTQRLLDNIINSMPSMLIGIDEDGRVIQWNKPAEDFTGIPFNDAKDRLVWEILPFIKNLDGLIQKALSYREIQEDQHFASVLKGKRAVFHTTVYPLTATGEFGVVLRIDDITEKHKIEEKIMQSEKMASVGGLAAGMAHEINNPLAGIIQSAQVLNRRLMSEQPANIRTAEETGLDLSHLKDYMEKRGIQRLLDSIREAGSRAAKIVENLLSFSSQTGFSYTENNLKFLIESAITIADCDYELRNLKMKENIHFIFDIPEGFPQVYCDGPQIQQVFLNLIKNASQALSNNGRVCSSDSLIEFKIWQDNDLTYIRIRDNGQGIPRENLKRVFEPFFTTREVGQGVGLGLSVAYFIITENHRGAMVIESEEGQGTEIQISLPITHE